jgi:hypothetical protein
MFSEPSLVLAFAVGDRGPGLFDQRRTRRLDGYPGEYGTSGVAHRPGDGASGLR